ncbi:MAG: UDP-N-acetylmuramate dehydrogenase [Bacteroidales bacterium]
MIQQENYSLVNHNTFHIEANAKIFIEYENENELIETLTSNTLMNNKLLQIGGGSNLLFTENFDGIVLHSKIKGFSLIDESIENTLVKIGAGEIWDDVVKFCVDSNLYGAENLSLIPGEIGAAAVQNIGAYGVEIKDIIEKIDAIEIATGSKRIFNTSDCKYAYRESVFKKELKSKYIITYVTLKLSKTPSFKLDYGNIQDALASKGETNLRTIRETIIEIRENKLPNPEVVGNAGSFFMNPYITMDQFTLLKSFYPALPHYPVSEKEVKVPAAWLIEQCGWKGKIFGNAGVHDKQSLVLINRGGAKAIEIIELSNQIRASVKQKFQIELTPEVIFV